MCERPDQNLLQHREKHARKLGYETAAMAPNCSSEKPHMVEGWPTAFPLNGFRFS